MNYYSTDKKIMLIIKAQNVRILLSKLILCDSITNDELIFYEKKRKNRQNVQCANLIL